MLGTKGSSKRKYCLRRWTRRVFYAISSGGRLSKFRKNGILNDHFKACIRYFLGNVGDFGAGAWSLYDGRQRRAAHDTLVQKMLQYELRRKEGAVRKRQAVDACSRCEDIARKVGSCALTHTVSSTRSWTTRKFF